LIYSSYLLLISYSIYYILSLYFYSIYFYSSFFSCSYS